VVTLPVLSREGTCLYFTLGAVVGGGVADDFAGAVDGAVGGFADKLGAAVAVEIVDHELGVVGALADVFAEVDLPEQGAVEFVGLEERFVGEAGLGVVAGAAGEVDNDLVGAVAIEVADGGVVGGVALGRAEGDRQVRAHRRTGGDRGDRRRAGRW